MTTVFLVRHGLNDHVELDRLAGRAPNVHLNEAGQAQAQALADVFSEIPLQAVYSSPLERTIETAEPIAGAVRLKVNSRPGLEEVDYGKWQGRTLKSLARTKLWGRVQRIPSLARFPEGESFPEAQARIVAELDTLLTRHLGKQDSFVCVSHGDMIKLAVAHYLGLPLDLFQRLMIGPASITTLVVHDNSVRLAALNDTRAGRAASAG